MNVFTGRILDIRYELFLEIGLRCRKLQSNPNGGSIKLVKTSETMLQVLGLGTVAA
jgi:hypothetical protein